MAETVGYEVSMLFKQCPNDILPAVEEFLSKSKKLWKF